MKLPTKNFSILTQSGKEAEQIVHWFISKGYKNIENCTGDITVGKNANYWTAEDNNFKCSSALINNNIIVYTFKQIKKMEENKEIIGYKLLKDFPDIKVGTIGELDEDNNKVVKFNSLDRALNNIDHPNISFASHSYYSKELCDSNPEWFQPIYEIEDEIFQLKCSKGILEVRIEKEYIICEKENIKFVRKDLESFCKKHSIIITSGITLETNTVDLGCCKDIKMSDILQIYNIQKELNNGK